jgi:hypothetical protein
MWARTFGARDEDPEQMQRWQARASPPENEFPAGVGLAVMLQRSDDAAVGITQIDAFSTGFQFMLSVRVRQLPREFAHGGLFMLIDAHEIPGVEISLEQRLLLGIEYPDGRRASTLRGMPVPGHGTADDDQRLMLMPQGGRGGLREADKKYWVSPLPPEGAVTFVLAWPRFGLAESRTVVDGSVIRAAAERSQRLWPPQPPVEPAERPAPPRPSSGWFAQGS